MLQLFLFKYDLNDKTHEIETIPRPFRSRFSIACAAIAEDGPLGSRLCARQHRKILRMARGSETRCCIRFEKGPVSQRFASKESDNELSQPEKGLGISMSEAGSKRLNTKPAPPTARSPQRRP